MMLVDGFRMRAYQAGLSAVNFDDAVLVVGSLHGSNFNNANLAKANFSGSDLSTATGLTQTQLNAACGDAETWLPMGLSLPACESDS